MLDVVGINVFRGRRARQSTTVLAAAVSCIAAAVLAHPRRVETEGNDVGAANLAALAAQAGTASTRVGVASPPPILLSRQLMREAGLRPGDVVRLSASADGSKARSFAIAGVYEPTPDPRRFSTQRLEARLHLPDLNELLIDPADPATADAVTSVNVALRERSDAEQVSAAITRRVPTATVESTDPADRRGDPFVVLDRFHWAIAIVTVVGSTAFLLALMVMRAEERRDVIGILRMMGVSSRSILTEVLLEGLLIAIAGAAFGVLVAISAQGTINGFFQWRFDTTLLFVRVTPRIAWQAVAFAVPLGVVAGLAASWTLLRRSVVSLVGR
jgi:ABC-type lipoprotein release transport system permease subunit